MPPRLTAAQAARPAPTDRAGAIAAHGLGRTRQTPIADCRACELCRRRASRRCSASATSNADWLFVGEGPGAEEDERGEPFVGQAGKLLDAMLAAIDLKRGNNVYIANSVKCRPPNNRTPEPEETAACWPFLERQIELIKPKLIVALGRPAAQTLLQSEVKISASRGRLFDYRGHTAGRHLPPGVSAAQPSRQGQGLGRPLLHAPHDEGSLMSHGSEGSVKAILYALGANFGIAVSKYGAAAWTGSGSMLAEAIHSTADCVNQLLLLLGMREAQTARDRRPSARSPPGGLFLVDGGGAVAVLHGRGVFRL